MLRLPKQDTELILKYLKEKYPGHYGELTEQQLERQPYHKRVWTWWQAMAHYKQDGMYERFEDIPDGPEGQWASVMGKHTRVDYKRHKGVLTRVQDMTDKDCESIYGE